MSKQMRSDSIDTGQTLPTVDEDSLCIAVVEAVADATGTSPEDLPSLTRIVDPDSLESLFATEQPTNRLTFEYADHRVTVFADRTVTVAEGPNRMA